MSLTDTTSFPGGIDVIPDISAVGGDQLNTVGKEHDALHDKTSKAVVALERVLVGPTFYNVEGMAGATFDDRWAAALALAEASGGVLVVPPGPKTTSGMGTITKPTVSIWCPGGAQSTPITKSGGGSQILAWQNSPSTSAQQGYIRGLNLLGSGSGLIGIDFTDTATFPELDDVILEITGTNARGMRATNTAFWNERAKGNRLHLNHCTVGMELVGTGAANSFAYCNFDDLRINIGLNQIGVLTTGTALVYSGNWHVLFNIDGNGGTVFKLGAGTSISGWGIIRGEQTTGTGGVFRDTSGGGTWAMSGYMNVLGCTDNGPILSPFEVDGAGRLLHHWPATPTVAMGAGGGTSPPAPTISGNDIRGSVLAGTGTSPALGDNFVTVTFASPYPAVPIPDVRPFGGITAGLTPYISAVTTTGFTIGLLVAPGASQPTGTYGFLYSVVG